MLQTVGDRYGYVVEFDKIPELPITYSKRKEKLYAQALARAIQEKQITEPGKYLLVLPDNESYEIFRITDEDVASNFTRVTDPN